jgi:DNA polymerase III delta prime subunit
MFKKAVKREAKLRLAIAGPSGSGKTYTALAIAQAFGGSVAVVDTEHGSASKYADLFGFDVLEMEAPFHPDRFIQAIREAAAAGYTTIVLDSLSHAWNGQGGLLELVEDAQKRMKTSNSFAAWKDVTPIQNRFIEGIVSAPIHVIATMRSKQEYVQEKDDRTGRTTVRKVGMAPVQRDGFEYEFDVFLDMDINNNAIVSKTRCPALTGKVFTKPGGDVANILMDWLHGAPAPVNAQPPVASPMATPPTNGNGHTAPAPTPKPAAPPLEVPPEVKFWEKPDDAYEWAVGIGASDNTFAARNAMKTIVEAHGGRFTKDNAMSIYTAYYHERMARAQEKAKAQIDNLDMATVAEVDPEGVFA